MSQSDYTIADQDGASFLVDINAQLAAIVSNNSGATEPTTTYAYQWWADTSAGVLKQRNAADNAWITIGTLGSTNLGLLALTGGTLTGALNEAQGADIASAATINLTTATGNYVHITGTTTITAITLAQGAERTVVFDGALTLTNGASLLLPTGANITTAAGDTAVFRGEAAGVVRCVSYVPKNGSTIIKAPAFAADKTTDQSVTSGAQTLVVWGSELFDTNSNFASNRFTPTVAGYYQINASIRCQATNKTNSAVAIFKNGTLYVNGNDAVGVTTSSAQTHTVSAIVFLNGSTDYVEIYGTVSGTTPLIQFVVSGANGFSGCLVRSA